MTFPWPLAWTETFYHNFIIICLTYDDDDFIGMAANRLD